LFCGLERRGRSCIMGWTVNHPRPAPPDHRLRRGRAVPRITKGPGMSSTTAASSPRAAEGLQAKLERHFGFKRFRAGQAEAVGAAVAGRDVLVIMPTGSGKSLCYQLPALELGGSATTLVVSPLISLMKDQADSLRGHGFTVAEMNSAVPAARRREFEA